MELAVGASEATIKSLLSKLGSLLSEEYALIRGVRGDIQFMNDELASMQAFLSNVSHSTDGHDDQTEDWMKQVREVAYDIEDCIDNFAHSLAPDRRGNDLWSKFLRALYELRTWCPRRNIAAQIAELKERAQHVGERRSRYGVRDPMSGNKKSSLGKYLAAEHQETTRQLVGIKEPVGVKDDMQELEKWITSVKREEKLSVLSIFGFGGVGKTTAAMALYRNCGVKFKRRAMVTVSHSTDPDVILNEILKQVSSQANIVEQQGQDSTGSISETKSQAALVPLNMLSFFQKNMSRLSQIWLRSHNQEEDGNASRAMTKQHEATRPELGEHKKNNSLRVSNQDENNIASRTMKKKQEAIQAELKKNLENNRYLLLIDDVWSSSTWQAIWKCLPRNEEGSRVIVTTRFEAVARTLPLDKVHHKFYKMKCLSDKEAKELFHRSLSECRDTEYSQPSQNEQQSKGKHQNGQVPPRLWEMCGGLPLAIVTMAGVVASNKRTDLTGWIEVCESLFPERQVCRKPEEFMRIINYCYNDLPSDLKTCSLYLCIFPKGRKISRKRVIRRWIAEGFVSEKQGLSVEDVAETCFNQLIERKIIRSVEHNSDGRVKSSQVHDMVHEYIISKAGEENFVTVVGGQWSMPTRSNKVRRLSIHNTDSKRAKEADSLNLSHVRSLTVFHSLDHLRFKSFKTGIVQVLDLEGCRGFKVKHVSVSDICEMILLKYLSLRGTDISKLPSNIGDLKYLETLDVRETKVRELPASVGQLERISNILGGNKRTREALKLPRGIKKGTMKTLRILSGIEIVEGSAAVSNLDDLTGLRKLAIYKLHSSDQMFEDLLSSIQYLGGYSLQALVIDVESSDFLNMLDNMSSPPIYLSALELSGKLRELPKWFPHLSDIVKLTLSATALLPKNLKLLSNLRTLFSLTFSICTEKHDPDIAAILEKNQLNYGCEIFVPAGGFVKLKLLRIFIPLLPSLNFSEGAMPVLERLELRFKRLEGLHGMSKLESLHDVILTVDGQAGGTTKSILDDLKRAQGKYALNVNE